MKENINKRLEKSVLVGKIILIIILGFHVLSTAYYLFNLEWKPMEAFCAVLEDTTIFSNAVCISYVFVAVAARPLSVGLLLLGVINIVLVNKLYSNQRWLEIGDYIRALDIVNPFSKVNPQLFAFIVFAAGIVILCISRLVINIREYSEKRKPNPKSAEQITAEQNAAEQNAAEQNAAEQNAAAQNAAAQLAAGKENTEEDTGEENNTGARKEGAASDGNNLSDILLRVVMGICLFLVCWAVIDYFVYDKSGLGLSRPPVLEWIPNILQYIAVISLAIILVITFGRVVIAIIMDRHFGVERISAALAVIIEVVVAYLAGNQNKFFGEIGQEGLNNFLNAVTDNVFLLLLVFIAMFLLLHIAWLIVLGILFPGKGKNPIKTLLSDRIPKIEKSLVVFVCNIFEGGVKLFNFIPDFFNTIATLFLDKKDLFPVDDGSDNKDKPGGTEKKDSSK